LSHPVRRMTFSPVPGQREVPADPVLAKQYHECFRLLDDCFLETSKLLGGKTPTANPTPVLEQKGPPKPRPTAVKSGPKGVQSARSELVVPPKDPQAPPPKTAVAPKDPQAPPPKVAAPSAVGRPTATKSGTPSREVPASLSDRRQFKAKSAAAPQAEESVKRPKLEGADSKAKAKVSDLSQRLLALSQKAAALDELTTQREEKKRRTEAPTTECIPVEASAPNKCPEIVDLDSDDDMDDGDLMANLRTAFGGQCDAPQEFRGKIESEPPTSPVALDHSLGAAATVPVASPADASDSETCGRAGMLAALAAAEEEEPAAAVPEVEIDENEEEPAEEGVLAEEDAVDARSEVDLECAEVANGGVQSVDVEAGHWSVDVDQTASLDCEIQATSEPEIDQETAADPDTAPEPSTAGFVDDSVDAEVSWYTLAAQSGMLDEDMEEHESPEPGPTDVAGLAEAMGAADDVEEDMEEREVPELGTSSLAGLAETMAALGGLDEEMEESEVPEMGTLDVAGLAEAMAAVGDLDEDYDPFSTEPAS